ARAGASPTPRPARGRAAKRGTTRPRTAAAFPPDPRGHRRSPQLPHLSRYVPRYVPTTRRPGGPLRAIPTGCRGLCTMCARVAPAAARSRVVDTVLRTVDGTLGVNTNAYAAAEALRQLTGPAPVDRVLVAGTGAAARSVGYATHLLFPNCQLGYIGRSTAAAE